MEATSTTGAEAFPFPAIEEVVDQKQFWSKVFKMIQGKRVLIACGFTEPKKTP